MYASYIGKINKLEGLKLSGLGHIITNYLEKYSLWKEKNTEILIEEKDFNTKYEISFRYDIKFNFDFVSGVHTVKDTELNQINLMFQGGSNSAVLVTLMVHHLQILKEGSFVPTLPPWQMVNIVYKNYLVPLLNIHTNSNTKQLLNILNKFNSVAYGYSLHPEMEGNPFYSSKQKAILAKLKIQTAFCIPKCIVSNNKKIMDLKHCNYLIASEITNDTTLFAKIYDDHCINQSTLDWSMDLHVSDILESRGLEILLPGIYEKAEIHIYDQKSLVGENED